MSLTGKPPETEDRVIANDGFFPDVVLSEFLAPYRIPAEYDNEAVITAVKLGIVEINTQVAAVKATKIVDGFTTLDACLDAQNEATIDGEYSLTVLYKKAVSSWAKAWLLQQFNATNRRNTAAESDVPAVMNTTDYWLNQSKSACYGFLAAFGLQNSPTLARDPDQAYVALL